jgi:hypothetical protein
LEDDNDRVPDEVRKSFPEVGEELKASLSENAPAEIEYIVVVSDIEKVSCEVYQNEKMLGVPVRGYVATSRRVNQKEWEDSIRWCSTELEHLTWTKISGGIRCWDQFNGSPASYQATRRGWGSRPAPPCGNELPALASAALVADRAARRIDETDLFAGKTMMPSESLRPA